MGRDGTWLMGTRNKMRGARVVSALAAPDSIATLEPIMIRHRKSSQLKYDNFQRITMLTFTICYIIIPDNKLLSSRSLQQPESCSQIKFHLECGAIVLNVNVFNILLLSEYEHD